MEELGTAIIEVLAQDHPQSVRHVWYCLCGTVVQKTDNG